MINSIQIKIEIYKIYLLDMLFHTLYRYINNKSYLSTIMSRFNTLDGIFGLDDGHKNEQKYTEITNLKITTQLEHPGLSPYGSNMYTINKGHYWKVYGLETKPKELFGYAIPYFYSTSKITCKLPEDTTFRCNDALCKTITTTSNYKELFREHYATCIGNRCERNDWKSPPYVDDLNTTFHLFESSN